MKVLILLSLCCAVFANPLAFREEEGREHQPRFALVPDTDGRMFLADLNAEIVEPVFNPVNDVFFLLFTRQNPTGAGQRIGFDAAGIRNSNFGTGRDTRFIIHGWNNNGGSPVNIQIRDGYWRAFDVNVIVVDWGAGANTVS